MPIYNEVIGRPHAIAIVIALGNAARIAESARNVQRSKVHRSTTWTPNATNPEIVLWNGFFNYPDWDFKTPSQPFEKCQAPNARRCRVTESPNLKTASAVVVHSRNDLNGLPPEHPDGQKYVFFSAESPEHLYEDQMTQFSQIKFDWLASYRLDSDIPAPYGWLVKRKATSLALAKVAPFEKRKKALWVVSNCVTNDKREDTVVALQNAGLDVDIIGKCGSDDPCARGDTQCNIALMNSYKFIFAFENSRCKGYITEKFWEAMQSAAVPVVLGAPKLDYLAQAPEGSFVYVADYIKNGNVTQAASFLNELAESSKRLEEYKAWQSKYDVGQQKFDGESFSPWWCDLCSRLVDDGNDQGSLGYPLAAKTSQGSNLLGFFYKNACNADDGENPPFTWKDEAKEESKEEQAKPKKNSTNSTTSLLTQTRSLRSPVKKIA